MVKTTVFIKKERGLEHSLYAECNMCCKHQPVFWMTYIDNLPEPIWICSDCFELYYSLCNKCDKIMENKDMYDESICVDCFLRSENEIVVKCVVCHITKYKGNILHNSDGEPEWLCQKCFDKYYNRCIECEKIVLNDEMHDEFICLDCFAPIDTDRDIDMNSLTLAKGVI